MGQELFFCLSLVPFFFLINRAVRVFLLLLSQEKQENLHPKETEMGRSFHFFFKAMKEGRKQVTDTDTSWLCVLLSQRKTRILCQSEIHVAAHVFFITRGKSLSSSVYL